MPQRYKNKQTVAIQPIGAQVDLYCSGPKAVVGEYLLDRPFAVVLTSLLHRI